MDQQPTARPSELPPPYDSSKDTDDTATPKHGQAQDAKTKTDIIQVQGLTYRQKWNHTRLPDSMFSTSPPPFIRYPDDFSYPNVLIKKGNVIYPAQNQSLALYYLPEATYWSDKSRWDDPSTYMYKRYGTFHGDGAKYATIPSKPECYTAFATFYQIETKGWKHSWRLRNRLTWRSDDLHKELTVWDSWIALSIQGIGSNLGSSKPVVIKRSVQSENTAEKGWLKTHSWSDSTTNEILAWEFAPVPGAPSDISATWPSSGDEHRFEFNEAVGKKLRDMLTAAWCISLWVDAETVRREVMESRKESRGILGRLARLWQSEEGGTGSSKPQPKLPNRLREELGLDEPTIPESPREMMWYEPAKKSTRF